MAGAGDAVKKKVDLTVDPIPKFSDPPPVLSVEERAEAARLAQKVRAIFGLKGSG